MSRPAAPPAPHPLARAVQAVTGPWTWANLRSWVLLIGAVFFIKGCIVDQYAIPTGSMEPILHGDPRFGFGDRVLVNKWVFGPRIPFTTTRLFWWEKPKRWDIVVFRPVPGKSEHPALIKRVVGLPGERVHIEDGTVYVNGEAVAPPESVQPRPRYTTMLGDDPAALKLDFLRLAQENRPLPLLNPEHPPVRALYADMARVHPKVAGAAIEGLSPAEVDALCEGVSRDSLATIRHFLIFTQPPLVYGIDERDEFSVVPEGHYMMLGDNSASSIDSRVYGWVPGENIFGRTFAVWWPWPRRRDFTGFSGTWWGQGLLYGIPAALIAFELYHLARDRRRRARAVPEAR